MRLFFGFLLCGCALVLSHFSIKVHYFLCLTHGSLTLTLNLFRNKEKWGILIIVQVRGKPKPTGFDLILPNVNMKRKNINVPNCAQKIRLPYSKRWSANRKNDCIAILVNSEYLWTSNISWIGCISSASGKISQSSGSGVAPGLMHYLWSLWSVDCFWQR